MMDILSDDSIVVSAQGSNNWPGTASEIVKFSRITGDKVCSIPSEHTRMADGMAVFTDINGKELLAFSYGLV